MTNMSKLVKQKIEEYGIVIFNHHPGEDDQYVFMCNSMVLFVHKNNDVSVAFQATTKPEEAATITTMLHEIPNIIIDIMDSFIYCGDKKLVCGSEAHQLIKDTIKAEGANDYAKEEAYAHLLETVNCHEC